MLRRGRTSRHQGPTSGAFRDEPHLVMLTIHSGEGKNVLFHTDSWNGYIESSGGDAAYLLIGRAGFKVNAGAENFFQKTCHDQRFL